MIRGSAVGIALACPVLAACAGEAEGEAWFREEAARRGLVFSWVSGHEERHYFPEIMGGGAALLDMDEDGDLDAYLVQAGSIVAPPEERPANQLFRNHGGGRFEDASRGSGAEDRGYGMGVATGDADEDGTTDLYVTNVGPNVLLCNRGGGRFEDVTARSGTGEPSWSTSAAFLDHDADGDLDLFVVNYVRWSVGGEITCYLPPHPSDYCSPKSYAAPMPATLYRNDGGGVFRDVSSESGVRSARGNGLGVVCSDFDGDGKVDVFVANDSTPNHLWRNLGDGAFAEVALRACCAVDEDGRNKAGMGTAAGDVDLDGDEDLFVMNLAAEADSFFRNDGRYFSDRTRVVGLSAASWSYTRFGIGLADFDHDGYLDLFEATGRVTRPPEGTDGFDEVDLLFRGVPAGGASASAPAQPEQPPSPVRFEEVLPRGGTREPLVATGRAAAFGDVDGDGGVDVLVVNRDSPACLLMNRVSGGGNWILFRVRERTGRDALGAEVRARAGERSLLRVVRSAYSYCAANDPRVHLGLGTAAGVTNVTVTWPDGVRERFGDFSAGQVVELARGQGSE